MDRLRIDGREEEMGKVGERRKRRMKREELIEE